jgi:LysM repeat protein
MKRTPVPAQAFQVSANYAGRSPLGPQGMKTARFRMPSAATAPALLGVAAAAALTLHVGTASASTTAHIAHAATTAKVSHKSVVTDAQLTAVVSPASASGSSYTVQSGDTLSSIAASVYGSSGDWSTIYQANTGEISNPNLIMPGEVLSIPGSASSSSYSESESAPASTSESTTTTEPTSTTQEATSTTSDGYSSDSTSTAGDSSFQECVINAESGGDSQVMNSSGHYGLYQFSASTWAEYGGNPADFGDASVAEQNQVFDNAIAAGGESNWAPYDGC